MFSSLKYSPRIKLVKLNFDASINQHDGFVGLGFIARKWASQSLSQGLDPSSVEAKAAHLAMDFARQQGWRKIVVEGDSSVVILAATNNAQEDFSHFGHIVADIQALASCFDQLSYHYISRDGNRVAHEVARLSIWGSRVFTSLPDFIQHLVSSETVSC